MSFSRQVSRLLDEEHRAHLDLLGQVEQMLARQRKPDPTAAPLLARLAGALQQEVQRHFDFEERELFPRLAAAGDGGIATLLTEEHATIREVAGELRPLLHDAVRGAIDAPRWDELRRLAAEFAERQVAHIQKETMALLPMLDDLLDEAADSELAIAYASA